MPDEAQRESAGVEGGDMVVLDGEEGAEKDAARRDTAKRTASAVNAHLVAKKSSKKKKEMSEVTVMAMETAVGKLGLENLGALLKPEKVEAQTTDSSIPAYRDTKEGCEDRSAQVDLFHKMVKALKETKAELKEAESDNDDEMVEILKAQIKSLTKALKQESERSLA